ncbi:hypothetical protein [Oceanisphaera sp. W20_SRM_FM3]|uniref:hypothetical protein n=1 Tax=Oceanisphaera sp. W20_SRM_FM3 TaxID=3240267 RepID=UPI003F97D8EE
MYHGFQLNADSFSELKVYDRIFTGKYTDVLECEQKAVFESIESFYANSGNLDGKKIKEAWFPEHKKFHVFISHSHSDRDKAERLANWLFENFKIESFIDSYVWSYANDLLRKIDDRHAMQPSGTYDYNVRNYTTSHVHMMLNNALANMIDSSECLIFINTNNAVLKATVSDSSSKDRTLSPWIMSELQLSKLIEKKQDPCAQRESWAFEHADVHKAMDSVPGMEKLNIEHPIDTEHLSKIKIDSLNDWVKNSGIDKGYDALTYLYRVYGGKKNLWNKE